jgi:hypothetical protein
MFEKKREKTRGCDQLADNQECRTLALENAFLAFGATFYQ